MDINRFKNYGLWVAIFAFIPMFLKAIGKDILPSNYGDLIQAFLGILVLMGLINNPTTENKGFLDDKADPTQKVINPSGEITNRIK